MSLPSLTPYKQFERQIERIHQLLEQDGSQITWNDHISDPDCPTQQRQIDISIVRNGQLTIVECRLRKEPQDVTWIEELIGRRASLRAQGVIAVSASGFTATARKKAETHGIILRDFATLSAAEIQSWGAKRTLAVSFCEFSLFLCTIVVGSRPKSSAPLITSIDGGPVRPPMWRMLIQDIMHHLDREKWCGLPTTINCIAAAPLLVDGEKPVAINVTAKVRRIVEGISVASVMVYSDPVADQRHAEVGKFDMGASEMIENGDRIAMIIDLSQLRIPNRCCFEKITANAGRVVSARPTLVGYESMINCNIPIDLRLQITGGPEAAAEKHQARSYEKSR